MTMQAVRILACQNMVSYRVPQSLIIKESYPLPAYSTVIGMVHAACGFTKLVPMQVSIQGSFASSVKELYARYEFGRNTKYEATRHQVRLQGKNGVYGMTRGPGSIELLTDVRLLLHIIPKDDSICETIAKGMLYPKKYLSLGRWEDLLRVDDVRITELREETVNEDTLNLDCSAWIPVQIEETLKKTVRSGFMPSGTCYRLNKIYNISDLGLRSWKETVSARYAGRGTMIGKGGRLLMDRLPIMCKDMPYYNEGIIPVFPA